MMDNGQDSNAQGSPSDVESLLKANPLYRPILVRILKYCNGTRRLLRDLEDRIAEYPEFKQSTHPQYYLIMWLVERGSLDMFELDAEGAVISDERKSELTPDEIDDLVEDWSFETNEVGREVLKEFDPKHRLIDLLGIVPERYDTYLEVLTFLQEKRSYAEVDALLRGRDVLMSGRPEGERPMQPSVFIDKLAASGGIAFDDGWMITEEGKELLDVILERKD
jgi:hypothetical protein